MPKVKNPRALQQYDDVVKMSAVRLYALYHSYGKVASALGVADASVRKWVQDYKTKTDNLAQLEQEYSMANDSHIQAVELVAQKALQQVYEKLPEASAAQSATIYGILFDKLQIMRGNLQTTTNNVFINVDGLSESDKLALIQRTLDRRKADAEKPVPIEITEVSDTK